MQTSFLIGKLQHFIFCACDPTSSAETFFFCSVWNQRFGCMWRAQWFHWEICNSSAERYQVNKLTAFILFMQSLKTFLFMHNMTFNLAQSYHGAIKTSKFWECIFEYIHVQSEWAIKIQLYTTDNCFLAPSPLHRTIRVTLLQGGVTKHGTIMVTFSHRGLTTHGIIRVSLLHGGITINGTIRISL